MFNQRLIEGVDQMTRFGIAVEHLVFEELKGEHSIRDGPAGAADGRRKPVNNHI